MTTISRRRRRLVVLGMTLTLALSGGLLLGSAFTVAPSEDDQGPADEQAAGTPATEGEPIAEASSPSTTAPVEPTPNPPATPTGPPPFPGPFEPAPNETLADAKQMGAAVAYRLTNYWSDSTPTELATGVTVDDARALALASAADTVHHPGLWSRGTVRYAQLGGHRNNRVSIMVVVDQELGPDGSGEYERAETRTMDVRLVRDRVGNWSFDELASAGGEPVARPADLSPLAASVVDDPRIDLPDSAIWDIYSGHTDPAMLRVMAEVAERTPYRAAVLHTGHPDNVFETNRVSNHTVGRAIDIYELDSVRVIDAHDTNSSIYELVEWLASRIDIREVGSPWYIPDAITKSFTDEVHHDHLHIGVYAEGQAPEPPAEAEGAETSAGADGAEPASS